MTTTTDGGAGSGSLREAIKCANSLPGADTIEVPAGTYTLTIVGAGEDAAATGDLDINGDLTIIGAGAATTIVDGNALDRVFEFRFGIVEISGLTIRNGSANLGSGILIQQSTLTLNSSTVSSNSATGFGGKGGGIGNGRTMTITNSTISGNSATGLGGGILNGGTMTITNSTVSGNTSSQDGGGIFNEGVVTITNSTLSNNSAVNRGGGIRSIATLTITNSTLSKNSAGSGGGIFASGTATLKNTIVANNTAVDCQGTITSGGNNLDSNGTCGLTGTGDIPNGNANLGPLALNAPGSTATHALVIPSDAIDAGSGDCPPPATDQRGVTRPQGTACDIGAFELEASQPTSDHHQQCYRQRGREPDCRHRRAVHRPRG